MCVCVCVFIILCNVSLATVLVTRGLKCVCVCVEIIWKIFKLFDRMSLFYYLREYLRCESICFSLKEATFLHFVR
uniref:Secreted protein n=1 Tax=Octopus bimaculoides TaxID=37653 RepID=A0A0L8GD95_OCTBM